MRSARLAAATLIVATAGVAVLALTGSGPASATADATAISFASPTAPGTVFDQAPLVLQGDVSRAGGFLDKVTVTVAWSDTVKGRVPGAHPPSTMTLTPAARGSDAPWSFQPSTPYNGSYTVTVVAASDAGSGTPQEQTTASSTFVADLPPAIPTNIVVTSDAAQRIVHVTWAPNSEPDVVGYWIIRAGPSAADAGHIVNGVEAPQTWFTDDEVATEPPGSYRYEVVAVRQNGAGNSLDVSTASQQVVATFSTPAKAVAPAPPPTTVPATSPSTTVTGNGASGATGKSGTVSAPGAAAKATLAGPPVVLPRAANSLPTYQALLNQARQTTVTAPPPDSGFSSSLPYQHVTQKAITAPVASPSAVLGAPDQGSGGTRTSIEFLAAALILAVLAMFGLVLKRSAEQAGVLEALAPAGGDETRRPAPSRLSLFLAAAEGAPRGDRENPVEDRPIVKAPAAAEPIAAEPAVAQPVAAAADLSPRRGPLARLHERSRRVAAALATGSDRPPVGVVPAGRVGDGAYPSSGNVLQFTVRNPELGHTPTRGGVPSPPFISPAPRRAQEECVDEERPDESAGDHEDAGAAVAPGVFAPGADIWRLTRPAVTEAIPEDAAAVETEAAASEAAASEVAESGAVATAAVAIEAAETLAAVDDAIADEAQTDGFGDEGFGDEALEVETEAVAERARDDVDGLPSPLLLILGATSPDAGDPEPLTERAGAPAPPALVGATATPPERVRPLQSPWRT